MTSLICGIGHTALKASHTGTVEGFLSLCDFVYVAVPCFIGQ